MYKKISIPLQKLLDEKKITQEEANRLIELSENSSSGSILRNIMILFGSISIIAGILGLVPNPHFAVTIAIVALSVSYYLYYRHYDNWNFIAQSVGLLSTLGISSWLIFFMGNNLNVWLLITLFLGLICFTLNSRFLAALIPLAIGNLVGMSTFYGHATYGFSITEPSMAILVFGLIALISYLIGKQLPEIHEKNCVVISRVSLFFVNMAFWIGSLWGDKRWSVDRGLHLNIPEYAFTITWAILLVGLIIWGAKIRNIYVVNLATVFLCIHAYTQYFEAVGASPLGLLVGGIILFIGASTWWKMQPRINDWVKNH